MPSFIKGEDVLLELYNGAGYVPILCATDTSIRFTADLAPTSTVGTGRGRTYTTRRLGYTISFSGVSAMVGDVDAFFPFDLAQPAAMIVAYQYRLRFTDTVGNTKAMEGSVLIESNGFSSGSADFATNDIELRGNGIWTITSDITTPSNSSDVNSIFIETPADPLVWDSPFLIGKSIIMVERGSTAQKIITSGSPAVGEMLFDSAAGTLTANVDEPAFDPEKIFVIFKNA